MASKLALRSHPLPFAIFSANRFLQSSFRTRPSLRPYFSTISPTPFTITDREFSYGPSLTKGRKPFDQSQHHQIVFNEAKEEEQEEREDGADEEEEEEEENVIDRESFTRVFDVAAIRIPAEDCFEMERRLRGHLLNWPRIRNIARVPGDEMEDEFKSIIREEGGEEDNFDSLNRRIYGTADGDGEGLSPVLYREKLARTFNSRGYVKFRNLAKISRPKRKNKKKVKEGEEVEEVKRIGRNDFVAVEVVENRDGEEEDLSGLLGDEFKRGRWRGSTRLLLLDERYANKSVEELPEVVKVAV